MRTHALLIVSIAVLAGCGGMPWESARTYQAGCLSFDSERDDLDAAAIENNALAAQAVLEATVPDFCQQFGSLPILIKAKPTFFNPSGEGVDGWSDGHEIHIGSSMRQLVHELIHVRDFRSRGVLDHVDWDVDGNWKLIGAYVHLRVFPYQPYNDLD